MVDVSTTLNESLQLNTDRFNDLRQFLAGVGDVRHLLRPEKLAIRLNALDELDAIVGDPELGVMKTCSGLGIIARANALRCQFEAANETLYEAVRSEIALHGNSSTLHLWLAELANVRDAGKPRPGLSFDLLDEIVSGVLQFYGPKEAGLLQSQEMAPYQPTPVRHILDLIAACSFSSDDSLVDLGSGLGHVPLLVSILTGIRTLGVEIQPDYVATAQEVTQNLNLSRVQFVADDARRTDLSSGTVFYLFSPFTGSTLADVLRRLQEHSKNREIRICALGPCTHTLQGQAWLLANNRADTEQVTVFKSQ